MMFSLGILTGMAVVITIQLFVRHRLSRRVRNHTIRTYQRSAS